MALKIKCEKCKSEFWVKGYSTPDTHFDPGETVIYNDKTPEDACQCYLNGESFEITDEEYDTFDDDVIV